MPAHAISVVCLSPVSPATKYTPLPAGFFSASCTSTIFVAYSSPLSSAIRSRAVLFHPQTMMWSR